MSNSLDTSQLIVNLFNNKPFISIASIAKALGGAILNIEQTQTILNALRSTIPPKDFSFMTFHPPAEQINHEGETFYEEETTPLDFIPLQMLRPLFAHWYGGEVDEDQLILVQEACSKIFQVSEDEGRVLDILSKTSVSKSVLTQKLQRIGKDRLDTALKRLIDTGKVSTETVQASRGSPSTIFRILR